MDSLQGRLLLASPTLGDPNFERTVILMLQHSDDGAMGLVLNRPTGIRVRDALAASGEGDDADCQTQERLSQGGPCEGPLMVLHGDPVYGQEQVLDGVYFATERDLLEPVLAGDVTPARFFAGYAGWTAGQLEAELGSGSWLIAEADAASIFEPGPDVWSDIVRERTRPEALKRFNPDILPDDPSVN